MAYILINDILDELRDEINRLSKENKEILDLLSKYRVFSINFQMFCVCIQKSNNVSVIQSLEDEYQRFTAQKKIPIIKIGETLKNNDKYEDNIREKFGINQNNVSEDMDSDCDVNNGSDTQISDSSEEELKIRPKNKENTKDQRFTPQIETQVIKPYEELKTKDNLVNNIREKSQRIVENNQNKVSEDMDSDCDLNNGSDTQISDFSEEEMKTTQKSRNKRKKNKLCPYEGCSYRDTRFVSLNDHIRRIHTLEKPFKCDECEKCFATKSNLRNHKLIHSNEKLKCEECHRRFSTELGLSTHIRTHLKNNSSNVCPYIGCGYLSIQKKHLKSHIRRTHTLEKPFKCEECGEEFFNKYTLKDHMSVHLGEEFECTECHKVFARKLLLNYHMQYHKDRTDQPLLKCEMCDFTHCQRKRITAHIKAVHITVKGGVQCDYEGCLKKFKNDLLLRQHKRKHLTGHVKCDWPGCEMLFKSNQAYQDHQFTHVGGSKPFKCEVEGCDKAFPFKRRLTEHMKLHDRRFVCSWPECGERCATPVKLAAHMNKHLNIKPFKCTQNECEKSFFSKDERIKHLHRFHYKSGW